MHGKPDGRTTRHAHRHGELLAALTDYVEENGYGDLSLRALAQAADVSHVTLLHHFGSRDDLLGEVMVELRGRDRMRIADQRARLGSADVGTVLTAVWRQLSSPVYLDYWRLFFETYGRAIGDHTRFGDFLDGAMSDWLELISAAVEREEGGPKRPSALATLVLGAFRGIILDLLVTEDRSRANKAIAMLVRLVEYEVADASRQVPRT